MPGGAGGLEGHLSPTVWASAGLTGEPFLENARRGAFWRLQELAPKPRALCAASVQDPWQLRRKTSPAFDPWPPRLRWRFWPARGGRAAGRPAEPGRLISRLLFVWRGLWVT